MRNRYVESSKHEPRNDFRYFEQQTFLNEIAQQLGVVAYRPDYHSKTRDCNTVLFYTKEDEEHNREVDKQGVRHTSSEARDWLKRAGIPIDEKYVYRDHFWSFENSNLNGHFSYEWANWGRLDLRSYKDWKRVLEGEIRLALAKKKQRDYTAVMGGLGGILEADNRYNAMNLELISAFKMRHGNCFLGSVNHYGDRRFAITTDPSKVYEEYVGQQVYNFCCDFVVPVRDQQLCDMIVEWNVYASTQTPNIIDDIHKRIETLGGLILIWF